jgi:UbiD family decarboxylase
MNRTSSLGEFLEQFRRYHPQDVFVVDDEVDVEYESTAYYKLLEEKNPVIWFSKVKGYPDFQLVTNIMGSRARMAFALGVCLRNGRRQNQFPFQNTDSMFSTAENVI